MLKRLTIYLSLLAGFAFVIYSCAKEETNINTLEEQETNAQLSQVIDGQYIVIFNEGAIELGRADISAANYWEVRAQVSEAAQVILRENRIVDRELIQTYAKVYQGIAINLSDEELTRLKADSRVNYIEQDQTVHMTMGGPPGGGGGGGGGGQSIPWGITRVGGPAAGANAGTAWIIDSGIDLDHPDLNVNTALSATFLGGNSTPDDQNGHGTHVAGTVAAIDNTIGVVGVAAGAPVVSVRVLDRRGSGSNSGVIAGVDYVAGVASNGDAANMSLGGGVSLSLDNAVVAASGSCPFALAAGNESTNANNSSPARANGNNIYTVSSMTSSGNWSSFSNYGNPPVDYCAPGSSIPSTYKDGGYATLSGTSMAAPHVCGILLLGNISSSGTVNGDPDGNPDPIAHR